MIVAVTGATGLVGEFLLPVLLNKGFEVKAMVHQTSPESLGIDPHPKLHWVQAELADVDSMLQLADGCDAVVHAAFEHVAGRYRGGEGDDPKGFQNVNFDQTKKFLAALQTTKVKRTIFISSRAVFDAYPASNDYVGDSVQCRPKSLYGEIKAQTEAFGNSIDGIGFATLRPTGIYGVRKRPASSKWWDLVEKATLGTVSAERWSHQLKTEVHGRDVAEAIGLLLEASASQVEGKAFNCSDVEISEAQLIEIAKTIAGGEALEREALPHGEAALNPMSCEGLRALGWRPNGFEQVEKTIRVLVDYRLGRFR